MEKFYGQFDPPVDQFIFERYFPDKNIRGVFVECGAFDGQTECSCKFFEESMGWTGYNLEPVPWLFEQLTENRPQSRNLNVALSNSEGAASFTAVDHPLYGVNCTNGSLAHTQTHLDWLASEGCKLVEVPVTLTTWSVFVAREGVRQVDLLVLDVEGHEFSVIEGMKGCPVLPEVLCIEIGHLGLAPMREALGQLGYVYDISSHYNAFFVREDRVGLFALRRADRLRKEFIDLRAMLEAERAHGPRAEDPRVTLLEAENARLRDRGQASEHQLALIQGSRGWRLFQGLRGLFGR